MKRYVTLALAAVGLCLVVSCAKDYQNQAATAGYCGNSGLVWNGAQCIAPNYMPQCIPQPNGTCLPPNVQGQVLHYSGYVQVSDTRKAASALNCRVYWLPTSMSANACNVPGLTLDNLSLDIYVNGSSANVILRATTSSDQMYYYSNGVGVFNGSGLFVLYNNSTGNALDARPNNASMTYSDLRIISDTGKAYDPADPTIHDATLHLTVQYNGQTFGTGDVTIR